MYKNYTSNVQYAVSPETYHLANYRGNQAGHDQYLRSDSVTPAQQMVFSSSQAPKNFSMDYGQSGYNQFAAFNTNQGFYAIGIQPLPYPQQSTLQATSPEAYHNALYRGNQLGHDQYLRSDSSTPAQQQVPSNLSYTPIGLTLG